MHAGVACEGIGGGGVAVHVREAIESETVATHSPRKQRGDDPAVLAHDARERMLVLLVLRCQLLEWRRRRRRRRCEPGHRLIERLIADTDLATGGHRRRRRCAWRLPTIVQRAALTPH
jgi:hypothetical protein